MATDTTPLTAPDGTIYEVPTDRLGPHRITTDEGGWYMSHPITCELSTCTYHRQAMCDTELLLGLPIGTYVLGEDQGEGYTLEEE